jgi:hypothetical protein
MASQKRRYHWDARKRKYIQMQPDEEVRAGRRKVKDGMRIKQLGTGLYKKWVKQNKMQMPRPGEASEAAAPADLSQR